jgi:hypothetical protein
MPWTFYNANGQRLSSAATNISVLDIDGATDIDAAIVNADLFIIDDGAGGTNRKTEAIRILTYTGGGTAGASAVKGYVRIAADGASSAGGYNIASITDTGTGDRSIVWDTDFSDANYSVITGSTENNQSNTRHFTFATGSVRTITSNMAETSNVDQATASIAIGAQ